MQRSLNHRIILVQKWNKPSMNSSWLEVRGICVWSSCHLEQLPSRKSQRGKKADKERTQESQKQLLPHIDPSGAGSLPWDSGLENQVVFPGLSLYTEFNSLVKGFHWMRRIYIFWRRFPVYFWNRKVFISLDTKITSAFHWFSYSTEHTAGVKHCKKR